MLNDCCMLYRTSSLGLMSWHGSGKSWRRQQLQRERSCLMQTVTYCMNRAATTLTAGSTRLNRRSLLTTSAMTWPPLTSLSRNRMYDPIFMTFNLQHLFTVSLLDWTSENFYCFNIHIFCHLDNDVFGVWFIQFMIQFVIVVFHI